MPPARSIITATIALLAAAGLYAQYQIHGGRTLDNDAQVYNMRSEMGHGLDRNLQVGGTAWNTPSAMTKSTYGVNRAYYQKSANITRAQYAVPYQSQAYHDAMARTGRNPQANPYGRAYAQPPIGRRIDGRAY